ncbi:DUF4393 domain-containing protein [uncultured Desulfovibrio sp.]|uniref:DUF4393 domain-containing protein n=1 Tax=uncultured Desulfovibrio sp. TaxID=167968 RepID=UPI00265CF0AB|nr:DUF4393 domain-containing protein [uncultured Desulfovibrio sp.]
MSEEQLFLECSKEASKEIAKEVYHDVVKPIIRPVVETVSLLPRAIQAALTPVEQWIEERRYNLTETKKLLQQKLEKIPLEQIVSPEVHIAVPAMQYISYCIDNDELRNMYANLLAKSMSSVVKDDVHPAFVEIIKQLCPDEAKIMKELYKNYKIPTLSVRKEKSSYEGINIISNFSNIGYMAKCECPSEIIKYFDNLIRLGLIEKAPYSSRLVEEKLYKELIKHPFIKGIVSTIKLDDEFISIKYEKSYMSITDFGKSFCSICLDDNIKSEVSSDS